MAMQPSYRLQDIIPLDEMEKIIQHFRSVSKLGTIISDFRGNMLTSKLDDSYYTPFCKEMRLNHCPYEDLCNRCDAMGSLEAARRGEPFIYRCHVGFVEIAAPIVVNDMYLGAILMGQVRTDPEKMAELPQMFQSPIDFEQEPELKKLYEQSLECSTYIPFEQLKAFAGLMDYIANFITQTALNHSMRDQLNISKIQYLEEQNRKSALEKDMAFLSLKNLRMRIHPHFLFNTLNIINGLAVLEDAPQTSAAINALSDTLRFTLKKQERLITLREEMQCVKSYLDIQALTLRNRVEFTSHVDERCLDALIPLFTIQLVTENSCIHGLSSVTAGGVFDLDVRQIGDFMHINVKDNGVGIDEDIALELNSQTKDLSAEDGSGSGLRTLVSSLRYYYGDQARWNISRRSSGGTHVQLIIPLRFGEAGHNEEEEQLLPG